MPETALSAEKVIEAAIDLLDDVGLRGFTMRALAQRLGTYPATIYWHVGSRGAVLSEVGAHVLGDAFESLPGPTSTPWDEWLAQAARAYRRAVRAHPAVAAWAVTHMHSRVTTSHRTEEVLFVLSRAGFRGGHLSDAYNAFMGSLVGWVGVELIADDPELGWDPEQIEEGVRALSADDYPTIVANLDHLANRTFSLRWQGGVSNPLDESFEFALGTWIEGLRRQLDSDG
jgi:TetR/AcrR family transcriptional regulator, tetracycline repressor protein